MKLTEAKALKVTAGIMERGGWRLITTGGNCTAFAKTVGAVELLLTETGAPAAPSTMLDSSTLTVVLHGVEVLQFEMLTPHQVLELTNNASALIC